MGDNDDSSAEQFLQRNRIHHYSDDSDEEPVKLDIGVDISKSTKKNNLPDESPEGTSTASTSKEHPKRDENSSFSFKHFLRYDVNNYQNLGARPKVYCDGRPITSISDLDLHQITMGKQTRMVPEFSSALPDFVQDHLVMEQSYLGKDLTNSYSLDLPNLPDFTPNQTSSTINRLNVYTSRADCRDDSVNRRDDTGNRRDDCINRSSTSDFPARPQPGFPLDLPISDPQPTTSRSCPPTAEAGVLKTLPDFLTDGPVRSQANDLPSTSQSPEREVDRLRLELENCRRELFQQKLRTDRLEVQLEEKRQNEHEYTQNLHKNLAIAEENLERSNRRAMSAEKTILKLRKEVKTLSSELGTMKKENNELRGEASGGPSCSNETNNDMPSHRLAKELRSAADSAEFSLRQLLKGVDNLRILASTVESTNRIEETPPQTFLDFEDTEPAL